MFSAQVLRHTVPAALSLPVTGSPPVRTITLLILPPAALTVIPRFGAVSMPPPTGVIDNCAPSAAGWLAARVGRPEQPAACKPSVAQITAIATAHSRGPNDRTEVALGVAARSNFEPPDCNQTAYARAAVPIAAAVEIVLGEATAGRRA